MRCYTLLSVPKWLLDPPLHVPGSHDPWTHLCFWAIGTITRIYQTFGNLIYIYISLFRTCKVHFEYKWVTNYVVQRVEMMKQISSRLRKLCKFVKKYICWRYNMSFMTDDSILEGTFVLKYELLILTSSLRLMERVWNTILLQTTELSSIASWPHIWVMLFVLILEHLTYQMLPDVPSMMTYDTDYMNIAPDPTKTLLTTVTLNVCVLS